jgi:hypothetical protein
MYRSKAKEEENSIQKSFQGRFSSHCVMSAARCPFALCITRANSALKLTLHC